MENFDEERFNSLEEQVNSLKGEAEQERIQADYFREAYDDAVRAMLAQEDVGWNLLNTSTDEDNFTNEQLQQITKKLRTWTDTNPLLSRGCEIRSSYLFGSGYAIGAEDAETTISVRAQKLIDDYINQQNVFGPEALIAAERARFSSGQHFVLFDKLTNTFSPIPFANIHDALYNPIDAGEVWYYQHKYSRRVQNFSTGKFETKEVTVWYPVDTYKRKGSHPATIDGDKVDASKIIVDSRVNRPVGATWGTPDSFPAAPWALAYSAYLRDGTKVLASLAEWAWKLSPKSKNGADKAGARVKSAGTAGGVAVTDMELQSLPRANAVDLNTGRPLAAQVAASLGISVVILLSDPGQSGAYGTAQTLTDPSIRTMKLRQDVNSDFLIRCLKLIGVSKPAILWEKMSPDVDYREQQTVISALGTGLFHADEARPIIAKLAGITLLHALPPEGYMDPNNSNSLNRLDVDADVKGGNDPEATQPTKGGGTSLTNSQGRANSAGGALGNNDKTAKNKPTSKG